jgi:hypothetical protein
MPASVRFHKHTLSDPATAETWLANVQAHFDDATRRIEGYRSMARQLLGWIGVILALELNLLIKFAEGSRSGPIPNGHGAIVSLGISMILQMACFTVAAALGYSTFGPTAPEEPAAMLKRIQSLISPEAREKIAAYHTRAYDAFYIAARRFSRKFNALIAILVVSLWLSVAAGFVFWASF